MKVGESEAELWLDACGFPRALCRALLPSICWMTSHQLVTSLTAWQGLGGFASGWCNFHAISGIGRVGEMNSKMTRWVWYRDHSGMGNLDIWGVWRRGLWLVCAAGVLVVLLRVPAYCVRSISEDISESHILRLVARHCQCSGCPYY